MRNQSPEQLEGRLNAHRKLLVALAAFIADGAEGRAFVERLRRDAETVLDHEEDPGVEPNGSFATQQIADDELQSIVTAALLRVQAVGRQEQARGDAAPESEDR
ncbi:hypothetical protein ASD36_11740 [Rhizobium sp. Root1334]|uniref:hypothetical protein n=2 Tax=Rhizobium TaxID=379 RepID=UPI00072AE0B1|nr:hypothetical protein [Rhizobium sp. Root1204]KQY05112.1 hypothetical protein ASD36_11740 [Rhizobium sp. Root1334]